MSVIAPGFAASCYDLDRDLADVFSLYCDRDTQPLFSERVPITSVAEFSDWLDDNLRHAYHDFMVVREAETGAFAGIAFSYDYHPFDLHCKVCVCMARRYWDTGLAACAGRSLVGDLFEAYPLRKVYALVYDFNERSLQSNLAAGFVEEAVLREYRYHAGAYHDCHVLAMTRERYEARLAPAALPTLAVAPPASPAPLTFGGPYPDYDAPAMDDVTDIVGRGEALFGDAPAFELADGSVVSYRDLACKVAEARTRLRDAGTRAGDPVGLCPTSGGGPEAGAPMGADAFAAEFFAALLEGAVPFLGAAASTGMAHVNELPRGVACVIASSGTTGSPKLVMLTRRGLCANLLAGLRRYEFARGDRFVSLVAPTHAFGLVCDLLAPLATGGTICIPSSRQSFFSELPRFGPTSLNVPPLVASRILRALWAHPASSDDATLWEACRDVTGGALRKMMCGSAGLSSHATRGLRHFGIGAYGCYGLSEASPCVSINREGWHKDGSAGLPLGCNEVRVSADGEILVRGQNVMAGYLGQPDLTARVLRDGWLHTGDVGRIDADGFLWVDGRRDDLVTLQDGREVSRAAIASMLAEQRGLLRTPSLESRLREDLGFTSFDLMEVCVSLEELLGRRIDFGLIGQVRTVGDLLRLA